MPSLTIRPYTPADADALFEAVTASKAELSRWLPWCHPAYSLEDSRRWIATQVEASRAGLEYAFCIWSPTRRLLGGCGLNHIIEYDRVANLGYWVRTSQTGRGVATEAVKLLVGWAFTHTELVRLEVLVAAENYASQRVAEKSGAVREGILRRRIMLGGVSRDAVVYSFVRPSASA